MEKSISLNNLRRFKQKFNETHPSIPKPTVSDNGKFLAASNGIYVLQNASSGGGGSGAIYAAELPENVTSTSSGRTLQINNVFTSYVGPTDQESIMNGLKGCFFDAVLSEEIDGGGGAAYIYHCVLYTNAFRIVGNVVYLTVRLPDESGESAQIGVIFKSS